MGKQPICEEQTPYLVLLYRKNRTMKMLETGLFVTGLALLTLWFPFRSRGYLAGAALWAIVTLLLSPALYRVFARPHYILFPDRLVIRSAGKEESVPLTQIGHESDLPYLYVVRGKRTAILAGDRFLEQLNLHLEGIKRGWNLE
jgi:hypothetical protein